MTASNKKTRRRGFSLSGFFFGIFFGRKAKASAARLEGSSEEVSDLARKLFDISTELSSSATEQAAALQETSSSAEEISTIVSQNAENARRSLDAAAVSLQTAERGRQTVANLSRSIGEISRSNAEVMKFFEDSNQRFAEIMKVITEVGSKTAVINDIVFQTKLLSFNAAVEAARAGEHGKGFAVVAEEVGNLAEMSGNASREISQMLATSIKRVQEIATETSSRIGQLSEGSKKTMEQSAETTNACGQALEEIVTRVSDVNGLVGKIATASAEQSTGIHEINLAINQLNTVMQSNAVNTQEAANLAQQLRRNGVQMSQLVRTLVDSLDASGSDTGGAPPAVKGKVLTLRPARSETVPSPEKQNMKLVVGGDSIPSREDNRFEEV